MTKNQPHLKPKSLLIDMVNLVLYSELARSECICAYMFEYKL